MSDISVRQLQYLDTALVTMINSMIESMQESSILFENCHILFQLFSSSIQWLSGNETPRRLKPIIEYYSPEETKMSIQRPKFDDLSLRQGDPKFSAWGLWGNDDELGTLNLITEDVRKAAALEVKLGKAISLKYGQSIQATRAMTDLRL